MSYDAMDRLAREGYLVVLSSVPRRGFCCSISTEKPPYRIGRSTSISAKKAIKLAEREVKHEPR